MIREFITHNGETVKGERLKKALGVVADRYAARAHAIRLEDAYADHVTEVRKDEILERDMERAGQVRDGTAKPTLTLLQDINTELTGECVALLA